MSSEAQKRKAKHNFIYNGCDKKTDKCKGLYWYSKKKRYEDGKRYVDKALEEIAIDSEFDNEENPEFDDYEYFEEYNGADI